MLKDKFGRTLALQMVGGVILLAVIAGFYSFIFGYFNIHPLLFNTHS